VTSLEGALAGRRRGASKAFVPYVTAGLEGVDPNFLRGLEASGADAIEVGIPFSDPVMDGPVIQEASSRSLRAGTTVSDAFDLVARAVLAVPVVVMTYLNPVLSLGMEGFLMSASEAGVSGVIVPDLPVDEAREWSRSADAAEIAPVFLAAPNSSTDRLTLIAQASRGFVYCVSSFGVTGERTRLSGSAAGLVAALRPLTTLPLLVGVGISTPSQATEACSFADGAVVGSALVAPLLEGRPDAALRLARDFREACR
jgi:tryptophan synthase alpha chain